MITVYHNDQFTSHMFNPTFNPGICRNAAAVQTNSLDEAYQLTNNIDQHWTENQGVKASGLSLRSTSVGDVLEHDDHFYVVEACGFRELSREEIAKITFHII